MKISACILALAFIALSSVQFACVAALSDPKDVARRDMDSGTDAMSAFMPDEMEPEPEAEPEPDDETKDGSVQLLSRGGAKKRNGCVKRCFTTARTFWRACDAKCDRDTGNASNGRVCKKRCVSRLCRTVCRN